MSDAAAGQHLQMPELTRRRFVGRSLVAAGGSFAAGSSLHPFAAALGTSLGGDIWAWEKRLSGVCSGCTPEAAIEFRVNGKALPVESEGNAFHAIARFAPGENEAAAVASLPDGRELRSAPVTPTARRDPRPTAKLAARIEGDSVVLDGTGSAPSAYEDAYIHTWSLQFPLANPARLEMVMANRGFWAAPAPATNGEYAVSLVVQDENGRADSGAAYDWTDDLDHGAREPAITSIAPVGAVMNAAVTGGGGEYDPDTMVMRFCNNNDVGARFLAAHGAGRYRAAPAMLLTLPELPCLDTGDEVGAEYQPYDQIRQIEWTDHHGLRADTKRLIAPRRGTPALRSRAWTPLTVTPAAPFFAYVRTGEKGDAPVVVLINFSATGQEASVALPEETAAAFAGVVSQSAFGAGNTWRRRTTAGSASRSPVGICG